MAPVRTKKRASGASPEPTHQLVPTKMSTPTTTTTRSPIKKRKGITLEQKQAIIENLQLEITDRARGLRAQYHARAQSLRSRVEMRVNRIPRSLLKLTMEELMAKCTEQRKRDAAASRPPPVPAKDYPRHSPIKAANASRASPRPRKRNSDELAEGDKENQGVDNPKKKYRGGYMPTSAVTDAAQVLSPTSTNARNLPRDRTASPVKSHIARPASPMKAPPSVARPTVASAARPAPVRKTTTSSTASSAVGTTANTRARRAAAPTAGRPPLSRPATRTGRRISESSDGSTATVVKKTVASKPAPAPPAKRTMMSTIRKGVAGATARKPAAPPKPAPASTAGSTRVLRKRG